MKVSFLSKLCLGFFVLFSTHLGAQTVEWNYSNAATAAGNGCGNGFVGGDISILGGGNYLSLNFSTMNLASFMSPQLWQHRDCRIRIPVRLPANVMLDTVRQDITYDWMKNYGPSGSIYIRGTFLGYPLQAINRTIPASQQGQQFDAKLNNETRLSLQCARTDRYGVLDIIVSLSTYQTNTSNQIAIDLSNYAASVSTRPCAY